MRARDLFPPVTDPGEGLSIWRFVDRNTNACAPVNYSDSDQLTNAFVLHTVRQIFVGPGRRPKDRCSRAATQIINNHNYQGVRHYVKKEKKKFFTLMCRHFYRARSKNEVLLDLARMGT